MGSPEYFQRDYERYQKCSVADIREVVRRHLKAADRLVVSFVPEQSQRSKMADIERSQVPDIGSRSTFRPPAFYSRKLPNGLTVILCERHELPKVAVGLALKSGATADPLTKPGVASMTAAMLDEGTTSRTSLQIQAELDRLGASLCSSAGLEISNVRLATLEKNLKPALQLMADLVLHPTFPEEELERQRKRRLDSILQERHDPPVIASRVFRSIVFGEKHPFGRDMDGNESSVKALTRADLEGFYQTFWRPNNAAIIFAGDITLEEATGLTQEALGSWQSGKVPEVDIPVVDPPASTKVYLVDRQDAAQSQIRVGSLGPKRKVAEYYAIELMNAVLGGAFTSRLNLNLREERGYTYGAFVGFSYGREIGLWAGRMGVQSKFSNESLAEFKKELNDICAGRPITSGELDTAKANLTRGFAQRFETLGRLVQQVAEMLCYDLPLEEISRYPNAIEEVTLEQAQAAATKYIDASRVVVVVVGDLNQIEKSVRELNLGEVIVVDVEGKKLR
ncbi:MAG: hypothetical protein DMG05_06325 [Acidobacteria bacterium]|nr:MAG: hypothetical protein DMG05_06325 [Acidobacteriota bacterium]